MKRFALAASAAYSMMLAAGLAHAQGFERGVAIVAEDVGTQTPVFSYRAGPESQLLFRGTALVPQGEGSGEVEFQDGRARVRAELRKLPEPSALGPYTLYVLWAVTMEGRASNLGYFELASGRGTLKTSVPLAQFALIVTAEPHFAVTVPSKAVVLRNLGKDVRGRQDIVRNFAERADYATLAKQTLDPKKRVPLELVQARYAMAIANSVEAAKYAPAAFERADKLFKAAEAGQVSKKSAERRLVAQTSRDAIQSAEDARREALIAKATAEQKAREEQQRLTLEEEARRREAAAQEEARKRELVLQEENRLAAEAAAAEAKKRETEAAEAAAKLAAAEATAKARAELTERLNRVLPTTDTPRGLVAQIAGVNFASGAATLNPGARESLARFSGIVVAYPDIRYIVEGHTDNVGSEKTNTELSLKRAITVRDYLIAQGVPASTIDVKGVGPASPVADNATPAGRAANRRVEIVMSGGPIGSKQQQ